MNIQSPASALPPPVQLETGTIVTLRMRGHSRTNGEEYFSPAIVLKQYDNLTGDLEVLIWDSTAGTHFNSAYPSREVSSRGDGATRELYMSRSNIGAILFSPSKFNQITDDLAELQDQALKIIAELQAQNLQLRRDLTSLMSDVETLKACIEPPTTAAGKAPDAPLPPPLKPPTPAPSSPASRK